MTTLESIGLDIRAKSLKDKLPVKLVAVDGRGGSGKSTFAEELASILSAQVLHTDDFASWDNPYGWSEMFIEQIIRPIQGGKTKLSYQPTSWGPDHAPKPVVGQPVTEVLILEGVMASRKELRPYLCYAVWVETPREVCLKRGLERDGQEAAERWRKWAEAEDKYIEMDSPQEYAASIVSGTS